MMNPSSQSPSGSYLGEVQITTVLRVEHRLLREMMEAMSDWLSKAPASASAEMRERVGLLAVALEVHAQREEKHLFPQLGPRSEQARHLVDMMVIVHDEVRGLFEEIETIDNPKEHLWTILDITETHFVREDEEVFPLAEELLPAETLVELAA
jgi:hemerythrin superfamily protein